MINFFKKNNIKITLAFMVTIIALYIGNIPYLNIFIPEAWYYILILVAFVLIFNFSTNILEYFSIALLVISIPWVILGSRVAVEPLGVFSFICLCIAAIKEALSIRNKK